MPNDNIVEGRKFVNSETNTDNLANKFVTTNTDQNNLDNSVSAEPGTAITSPSTASLAIVEYVELRTSPLSAGMNQTAAYNIIYRHVILDLTQAFLSLHSLSRSICA